MNFQAFGSGVLIKAERVKEHTNGGLYKGPASENPDVLVLQVPVEVLSVGKDVRTVEVGMFVLIGNNANVQEVKMFDPEFQYWYIDEYGIMGNVPDVQAWKDKNEADKAAKIASAPKPLQRTINPSQN